jgi:quercetin dioxygenase-like cupin family protein
MTEAPEETWTDDVRGDVRFRTLIGDGSTPTGSMSAGVSELAPGGRLGRHRHAPAEVYHVLAGRGTVEVEGTDHEISAGATVFIPGNSWHAVRNPHTEPLRVFYVFAVDSFDEVDYDWELARP